MGITGKRDPNQGFFFQRRIPGLELDSALLYGIAGENGSAFLILSLFIFYNKMRIKK